MSFWIADRRLVLARDADRVLRAEEPQVGTLLAPVGRPLDEATCRRYGLGPFVPAMPHIGKSPSATAPIVAVEDRRPLRGSRKRG